MIQTYKPKLIEVALPLDAINTASAREKSIRHGHPSTFHLWWARRPLAAARAVIWASLVDDPSADDSLSDDQQNAERRRLFTILEQLVLWENIDNVELLAQAQAEIDRCYDGEPPAVLDPFGGGGTIPLEAQRLGLKSLSGDLNPVAVLIHRAMLDLPGRFSGRPPVSPEIETKLSTWSGAQGLAADVEAYAEWVKNEAFSRLSAHYPNISTGEGDEATPIAWIWARTVPSTDPSWPGPVPLVKSWVLRKKSGKPTIWVEPIVDRSTFQISYKVREGGEPPAGTVTKNGAVCIATGSAIPFEHIRKAGVAKELGESLLAVVAEGTRGRSYHDPTPSQAEAALDMEVEEAPKGSLPSGGLGFRIQRYGFTEWADMFTRRQTATLAVFAELLDEVRVRVAADALAAMGPVDSEVALADGGQGARAYGEAISTYLAFVLDRCAARWCSFTAWHNGRETVEHVFRRQAISMNWDYPEPNPFSSSTGNWMGQVAWVTKCLELFPATGSAIVEQMDAAARVRIAEPCVISTDPPYYDNVGYADLSDFYYVWLRQGLSKIWPNDFATLLTPKADELIADPTRHGSKAESIEHFEQGMNQFFEAVAATQHASAPATIFYAFKQTETRSEGRSSTGWETFLQGVLNSGLAVTATWPVRTEMTGGLRHVGRNSLASSVVLACRPRAIDAPLETRGGFVSALRSELAQAVALLQAQNIAPVDLAQSAIGPGMRIFSRYARVVEADGSPMTVRVALQLINEILGETLLDDVAELDAESRFALTWLEQFRYGFGTFGDADVLARAKDTSVEGVVESGIAERTPSGVRLLERESLADDWSPRDDARPTDWEAVQHLIRQLMESETKAAQLLRELGGLGERARQLAYLLYAVCERLDWAEEAASYNGLITAWPSLVEASASDLPGQQRLV